MSKAVIMARRCITCEQEKSTDEFYQYQYVHGYRYDSRCKDCARARRRERYKKVGKLERRQHREWYAANTEAQKAYRKERQKDPEHRRNKAKAQRVRKARIRAGTQVHCGSITKLYQEAMELETLTGIKFHVDHIVPLCKGGTHEIGNLQILTAKDNLRKGGTMPAGDSYE